MNFRLKAFGIHLLASVCALSSLLVALYFGWYQWPGWYLTGMWHITAILGGVRGNEDPSSQAALTAATGLDRVAHKTISDLIRNNTEAFAEGFASGGEHAA